MVSEQLPSVAAISVLAEEHAGEFSQRNTLPCPQLDTNPSHADAIPYYYKAPFSWRAGSWRRCSHTHAVPVQTPSEQGSSPALTAIGLSRHFPAMSSGPHVWIFFPEDFGKIAPAFPCMFQSELHGVPEPGGSEPGKMHDSQGLPGLDEGRRALRRAGSGAGQAAASSQGCQQHSDQIKAIPAPAAHCSFPNYVDC